MLDLNLIFLNLFVKINWNIRLKSVLDYDDFLYSLVELLSSFAVNTCRKTTCSFASTNK